MVDNTELVEALKARARESYAAIGHLPDVTLEGFIDWQAALALQHSAARCAKLETALGPFAELAGEGSEDFPDETQVIVKYGRTTDYALRLSDIRRARAALAGEGT